MAFHSFQFVLFAAAVTIAYNAASSRARPLVLLLASYAFYASLYAAHVVWLLCVTATAYAGGRLVSRHRRPAILVLVVAAVALPLVVFKYGPFVIGTLRTIGVTGDAGGGGWLLPAGISFYTFQAISYVADVYCGRNPSEPHLGRFALSLAYFPKLLAGPIERSRRLLPQLASLRRTTARNAYIGARSVLWGLFCKLVVADNIAHVVDAILSSPKLHSGSTLSIAFGLYSFQIYFDFLGYTSIAIGVARWFNVRLSRNFRRPYSATSLRDFWRRWHVTLSTWFRDYVYIPLGGNRTQGPRRTAQIMTVFVVSGLWHGAALNFIVWGAFHGGAYAIEEQLRRWTDHRVRLHPARTRPARRILQTAATFAVVTFGWIFFRMPSMAEAKMVAERILFMDRSIPYAALSPVLHRIDFLWFVAVLATAVLLDSTRRRRLGLNMLPARQPDIARELLVVNWLALTLLLLGDLGSRDFLYFRF